MRYELQLSAYDMFDQVSVSVRLRQGDGSLERPYEWTTLTTETYRGSGEDDPRKWARDALLWAAESL